MKTSVLYASLALASMASAREVCEEGKRVTISPGYTVEYRCNKYRAGQRHNNVPSHEDCAAMCEATDLDVCTYHAAKKMCIVGDPNGKEGASNGATYMMKVEEEEEDPFKDDPVPETCEEDRDSLKEQLDKCHADLEAASKKPLCGIGGDGDAFYTSKTVNSVLECVYTCEIDNKCLSSEFKPSNGKCWLYDKPVGQAKIRDDDTGTYIFNDKKCPGLRCGLPADGSDYYAQKNFKSTEECQSACKADSACLSSEFRYDNGNCWLYSKPVFKAKTRDTAGEWVFYDRDCPALQCWVPGDGSDFYTMKQASSARDCLRACKNDDACLSSEYKKSNGNCWLYDKPVAQAKNKDTSANWIFFDKDCSVEA